MKKILWITGIAAAGLVLAEKFFGHASAHQKLPGFYVLLGFFGGFLLMKSAKLLGEWMLYRKENYYD